MNLLNAPMFGSIQVFFEQPDGTLQLVQEVAARSSTTETYQQVTPTESETHSVGAEGMTTEVTLDEPPREQTKVFALFQRFPKEIWLKIWHMVACSEPKVVDIWAHLKLGLTTDELASAPHIPAEYLKYKTLSKASKVPAILHVCKNAREVGLQYYAPEGKTKGAFNVPSDLNRVITPRIWVNWEVDTLLLVAPTDKYDGMPYFRKEDFLMLKHTEMVLERLPPKTAKLALYYTNLDFIQQMKHIEYPSEILLYNTFKMEKAPGLPGSHPASSFSWILPRTTGFQLESSQHTKGLLKYEGVLEWM